MSTRESLLEAMRLSTRQRHRPLDARTRRRAGRRGDDRQAIHDVYCGITADHDHPTTRTTNRPGC